MKNCKYTLVGKRQYNHSYEELVNIVKRSPELAHDILYSKDYNLQTRTVDKLSELKELGKRKFKKEFSDRVDVMNGCAEINTSGYTTLSYIDSGLYIDALGRLIMPSLDIDEYIEKMKALYLNKGMSKDEVEKGISTIKNSWKRIAEDGRDLHKILLKQSKNTSYSQTEESTKGTSFEHLSDIIKDDVASEVYKLVFLRNGKESKELGDTSSPIPIVNLNLEAKLVGVDETITGHIDYLIVKPNGSIEIFNIKSSHESPAFWDKAKKEKYRNEFALLSRILQYNGINVNNIRFNIIPVVLEYDDQFLNIKNINVNKAECYSHNRGAFIMQEEMKLALKFIVSNVEELIIKDSSIDTTNTLLEAMFPKRDIKALGIALTIEEYIDKNWKYWTIGEQPDSGYNLLINGQKYTVKSSEPKSKNKEVLDIVRNNYEQLIGIDSGKLSARGIINLFEEFRRLGFTKFDDIYLDKFFQPYLDKSVVKINGKDKYNYTWQIVKNDTLTNCNILMFKNALSGQINIVSLSGLNLNLSLDFDGGTTVLGFHMADINAVDNQGHELMKATYGNIETMRVMFLLNEIIPQLGTDVKLGDVSIVGGLGTKTLSLTYPIELVISNFVKATLVLNKKESNMKIENNFSKVEHISPVSLLINEFWNIMLESPNLEKTDLNSLKSLFSGSDTDGLLHLLNGTTIDSLASAENTEIQIQRLEEIILRLNEILKVKKIPLSPDKLIEYSLAKNIDPLIKGCCNLLINASITLDRLSGVIRIVLDDLSDINRLFARPQNISNTLVRIVSKLLQDAVHSISNRLDTEISDFNLECLNYYKDKGYSKTQNALIGNQSDVFKHLFLNKEDELIFKNPFDETNDLDDSDRKFLKNALFVINKIRFLDTIFPFKDGNDKSIRGFIDSNPKYLWVPLEEASESTKWSNPKKYFDDFRRRTRDYCKNPSMFFKEMYEGIVTPEEEELINRDIENMLAYNKFKASDTLNGRDNIIKRFKEKNLIFETNIQNLVIDYAHKNLQEEEMNKMLTRAKGIMLQLKLTGINEEDDKEKFVKTINHVDDYIKTSVFNRSIMGKDSRKIIALLQPFRKMVSTAYIALSPVAAIRDIFGGFFSNVVRTMTKYRTDTDAKDVMWAYQFVLRQGVHSAMTIDLLDKFNSKYLISNINIEQLQEGYKTNRGGITNPSNWAYATLRKPDFLNRMVLFMGKLKHDGSNDAYSVVDGKLIYNWRMDKRFSLLAANDKSNMTEYNLLKSLYLSQIIKFNEENPSFNLPVNLETNLPDGYTLNQIDEIKNLGDTIYGSYDKSTKSMYENLAMGSLFGVFSTWMNGIYDVYLGGRRESSYETLKVLREDVNGNKLWLDENGNITTTDTGVPFVTDIPLIVQGVLRTLGDMCKEVYHGRGLDGIKSVMSSPSQRRNIKRLIADILMWALLYYMFKLVFDPAYQEHKKNDDGKNIMVNAVIELLYKGASGSYEEFKGPLPIIDYVSNNTKPAAWQWGLRAFGDTFSFLFGEKTFGDLVMKSAALPRSLLDSYRMYKRDTMNGIGE